MSSGFFGIGLSGLAVAQLNLLATEHNIVNANTDGYTRQRVVQASNVGIMAGTGAIGQGVTAVTTERLYDQFLNLQLNSDRAQASSLDAYYGQISQIDGMLADVNAGLSPALQDFFAGAQKVAASPSLLPARQSMISSAETMVTRFQTMETRLVELSDQVNSRISNAVMEVNAFAGQVADLNKAIRSAESSYGQPANDLRDQRDLLVAELNKRIKVTTTNNSDGTYNLFFGSGQQLVVGTSVVELTAKNSLADPSKVAIGLSVSGGNQELPDSLIVGGGLGGLVAFRNEALGPAQSEIGKVAASLALTFNAQHALGQDLQGNTIHDAAFVKDFFIIPQPKVIPNADPSQSTTGKVTAKFAAPIAPKAPDFSGNFYTELRNDSYEIKIGASGGYSITRQGDNYQLNAATEIKDGPNPGEITFGGITVSFDSVVAGDRFLIKPFAETSLGMTVDDRISADPDLLAVAAPVRVTPLVSNTGTMAVSQGRVGVTYDTNNQAVLYGLNDLPVILEVNTGALQGNTPIWTATYSDGSRLEDQPAGSDIPLNNGGTLVSLSFSNMSFDISGVPKNTDKFKFSSNANGVQDQFGMNSAGIQDGRNALLFTQLQTQNTIGGGVDSVGNAILPRATFQASYSRLVADNGIRAREAKVQSDARTAIFEQTQASRDSLSAVNLDEEAANLLKFQQAYQASSKILAIGSKLFDSILQIG